MTFFQNMSLELISLLLDALASTDVTLQQDLLQDRIRLPLSSFSSAPGISIPFGSTFYDDVLSRSVSRHHAVFKVAPSVQPCCFSPLIFLRH